MCPARLSAPDPLWVSAFRFEIVSQSIKSFKNYQNIESITIVNEKHEKYEKLEPHAA